MNKDAIEDIFTNKNHEIYPEKVLKKEEPQQEDE